MEWPITTGQLTDMLVIHPARFTKDMTPGVEWPPVLKAKRAWNRALFLQVAAAMSIDNAAVKAVRADE